MKYSYYDDMMCPDYATEGFFSDLKEKIKDGWNKFIEFIKRQIAKIAADIDLICVARSRDTNKKGEPRFYTSRLVKMSDFINEHIKKSDYMYAEYKKQIVKRVSRVIMDKTKYHPTTTVGVHEVGKGMSNVIDSNYQKKVDDIAEEATTVRQLSNTINVPCKTFKFTEEMKSQITNTEANKQPDLTEREAKAYIKKATKTILDHGMKQAEDMKKELESKGVSPQVGLASSLSTTYLSAATLSKDMLELAKA